MENLWGDMEFLKSDKGEKFFPDSNGWNRIKKWARFLKGQTHIFNLNKGKVKIPMSFTLGGRKEAKEKKKRKKKRGKAASDRRTRIVMLCRSKETSAGGDHCLS